MEPTPAKSALLYPHDSQMPPAKAILAALQQLVAMFVGCITPALIFCSVVGVTPETQRYLISMSLFTAGIGTFLQAARFGPPARGYLGKRHQLRLPRSTDPLR